MIRVALTGGIATGKSHVRALMEAAGVPTIDADVLARDAVAPGSPGLAAVIERFGPDVLDAAGALDRRRLGEIVFADPAARQALERIVHPIVQRAIRDWFATLDARRHPVAVADIPLLFETGREGEFDAVVVTACDERTQLRRIVTRDGLSEEEARARVAAQMPLAEKIARADYVVRTDGPLADTEAQVRRILDTIG